MAAALNTLVLQYISQQRWHDALEASRRAAALYVQLAGRGKVNPPSEGGQRSSPLRRLVQAAYSLGPADAALMDESYMAAQRALHTDASLALSQLAARHAAGSGALAGLVREQQDLMQELESRDRLLVAAVAKVPGRRDQGGEAALRARLAEIASRIDAIGTELGKQFPEYTALSQPAPLSIAATQALLQPDEALIQFLDVQSVGSIPETGFAWLITKTDAQWVRLPIGTRGLAKSVAALRCGLDAAQWLDGGAKLCRELLKVDAPAEGAPLPFNLEMAHELHEALLGAFGAKLEDKHLLVVPVGCADDLAAWSAGRREAGASRSGHDGGVSVRGLARPASAHHRAAVGRRAEGPAGAGQGQPRETAIPGRRQSPARRPADRCPPRPLFQGSGAGGAGQAALPEGRPREDARNRACAALSGSTGCFGAARSICGRSAS